ncbi:hypothetical protein GCM10009578_065610 [Streptomyces rhizosphaericus]
MSARGWTGPRILRWHLKTMGISQQKFADRIGVSPTTVQGWLTGKKGMSQEKLERVAETLQMNPQFRELLYELVMGFEPPPLPSLRADPEALQDYLQDYGRSVEPLPFPAHASDLAWNILASNSAWHELMAPAADHPTDGPHVNIMRFTLFHPEAPRVLADWLRRWLVPMLAKLSQAMELHSDHPDLIEIDRDVRRRPQLARMYQQAPSSYLADSGIPTDIIHPDGNEVRVNHPDRGRIKVRMRVKEPLLFKHLGFREVMLIPVDR